MLIQNTSDVELVAAIKTSIKNMTPLSVVRCGDGEMHILKQASDFPAEQQQITHHHALCNIQHREDIWTCVTHTSPHPGSLKPNTCECYLTDDTSKKWRGLAKEIIAYSIKYSDYVGLVVPGRNVHYYNISDEILKRYDIDSKQLSVISSLFPLDPMFGSIDSFKSIINGNDIHIITPNVERFKNGKIEELLGVNVTYTDISGAQSHTIEMRAMVKQSIIDTPTKIILFGGGYAIKSLIPWAANELGKIALDIGSVLDAWSGLQSRHMFMKDELSHLNWIKNN